MWEARSGSKNYQCPDYISEVGPSTMFPISINQGLINVHKVKLNAIPIQQYYKLQQYVNILEINNVNFQPTLFSVWIDWEGLQSLTSFVCPCTTCSQRHNSKWQSQQNEGQLPPEQVSLK